MMRPASTSPHLASRPRVGVVDVLPKQEQPQAAPDHRTALVVTPHPLLLADQRIYSLEAAALHPGETLAHFLARHGVQVGEGWAVDLGGVNVPEAVWHRVYPKHGHLIEARKRAQQEVLKFVAVAALIYFTGGLASGGVFGFAGGSLGASLISNAIFVGGMLLINALLSPKAAASPERVTNTVSPSYSLQGGRNRLRPFEPMGLVLGEPYCVPDLAAQPFTYFDSGEQYLRQAFHAGLNCDHVDSIRIGQTDIHNYINVGLVYQNLVNTNESIAGAGMGFQVSVAAQTFGQVLPTTENVDTVAGGLLDAPAGTGAYVTRTGSVDTIMLGIDLEGQLFAANQTTGSYEVNSVVIEVGYRLVGAGGWTDWFPGGTVTLENADTKPLRRSFSLLVPAGQYEVQMRKISVNETASGRANTVQWSTLRSHQRDTANYTGQGRVVFLMQASGQLNGSLDEVNWLATAKSMPYWNGAAWVTATTRATGLCNPGALLLQLARGIYDSAGRLLAGLGLPDAEIDIPSFQGFMVRCAAKAFEFDYFVQESLSVEELLDAIAAVGMGSKSYHTGKFGVIWFSESDPVESVINMAEMKAKSFSVQYVTASTADELEYSYFDRTRGNTWQSIRITAPGVSVVGSTGTQRLMGVSTEAHAALLARFAMAQNAYQRKLVSCEVDLSHLTFRRGTVVALSHDVTQWGYGGRIKEAVNNAGIVTLTLDDLVPELSPSGGSTRYVGLRLRGEAQYRIFACTPAWLNLLTYSEQLDNAWWAKSNASVTANAAVTPGGKGADKLVENTATSTHFVNQATTFSFAAGDAIVFTALAKAGERSQLQFRLFAGGAVISTCLFVANLATGAITAPQGGAIAMSMVLEGDGWYRMELEVLAGQAGVANGALLLAVAGNNTYLGDGASGAFISEVQISKGTKNLLSKPDQFSDASWGNPGIVTANTTLAPNGALAADTLTDSSAVAFQAVSKTVTVVNDQRSYELAVRVLKTTGATSPTFAVNFNFLGGSTAVGANARLNTDTAAVAGFNTSVVSDGNFWKLVIQLQNNGTGHTSLQTAIYPASAAHGSFSDVVSATGSAVVADVRLVALSQTTPYEVRPAGARRLTLGSAWPGGVAVPGDSAANPAMDSLWIYDFKATPGQKLRVTEIQPNGNLESAKVTLVPESDEFWTYVNTGTYTAPPSSSLLQGPPVVSGAVVSEQLKRQGNSFYAELTVTFNVAGRYERCEVWGAIGTAAKTRLASTTNARASWQAGLADTWNIELRPYSSIHAGTPVALAYTVLGLSVPPPAFDTFLVSVQPDGIRQFNFAYSSTERQPLDWLGAEIRYVSGTVGSPDWATMTPLQDATTHFTASPVEINAPLAGTWTFACKSLDTSGNASAMLVRSITLPDRSLGSVFEEFFERAEGWAGTKTSCHVQDGNLEANDSTTWATLPATWAAWTRWNVAPASPITYETPGRNLGAVVAGRINTTVDADGTVVQELATSSDGSSWSGWSTATAPFTARWIKLRLTVTATGPAPVPLVRQFDWQVSVDIKSEYINDVVISALTGSYRTGTGDIRIPLTGSYTVLKRTSVVIQDSSAGAWVATRIDQSLSPAPRWQFRLNGTLADPSFVDFFVEGY